jgi:hypothetical protein
MKGQLYRCISPAPEHLWSNEDGRFVDVVREGDIVLDIDSFPHSAHVEVLHKGRTGHIRRSCLKHIDDWTSDAL